MTAPLTTVELLVRLKRHYIKPGQDLPGGIFIPEVSWNGRNGSRRCDALHVGFTSTSGQILTGHELKVSRADLLHELSDVHKASEWADQCHRWYLVVNDPAIAKGIELPPDWGLMAPGRSKTRMDVVVNAITKPIGHTPSWDAVRSIMARQDTLRANAIVAERNRAHDVATAEVTKRVNDLVAFKLSEAERTGAASVQSQKRLQELCDALGVRNIDWTGKGGIYSGATLDEVRQIGEVLRATRTVDQALKQLTSHVQRDWVDKLAQRAAQLRETLDEGLPHGTPPTARGV